MSDAVLEVAEVETCYGLSQVLFGMSLRIAPGEMVTLMGRNGMGKTTFLRAVMGHIVVSAGRIALAGRDLVGLRPFEISNLGVGYVPQGREIFPRLTVAEWSSSRWLWKPLTFGCFWKHKPPRPKRPGLPGNSLF